MSPSIETLKQAATGREVELLTALAGIPAALLDGRGHPCPKCGGTDRFALIDRAAGAVLCRHCFSHGNGDWLAAVAWHRGIPLLEVMPFAAEYLGLHIAKPKPNGKAHTKKQSELKWLPSYLNADIAKRWAATKPGVNAGAAIAAGARACRWCGLLCIAFQGCIPGNWSKPTGTLLYRVDGANFAATRTLAERKTHSVGGGHDGLVIVGSAEQLGAAETVWKCEGLPDALTLAPHLPAGHIAVTNICGASSWSPAFASVGKGRNKCVVVGDADKAGDAGARKVVRSMQGTVPDVRQIQLPYEIAEKNGKDLRDFFNEGHTMHDLLALADSAKPIQLKRPSGGVSEPESVAYVSFPTDLLPSPAREFVEAGAAALGCDPAYIALPLLSALASAVGNSRRVKLKESWCEPCVLWTVIIGESGTLKSPALDLALEALRRRQAAAYREYQDRLREYERLEQLYQADVAQWKNGGRRKGEPAPEKPEPPIWRQSLAEDTTVEALAVLLENQPRGLLVARDELSGWLNSFDAYKSARGADVAHYLSMHRAGSMLVNRKSGRNIIRVPRASVSICGGVQPTTLAAALAGRYSSDGPEKMDKPQAEHFANGLAARLLLAMPPRRPKKWTEADLSDAIRGPMDRRFDDLLILDEATDENGELVPMDLPLTPAAKHLWVVFYNEHAREQCNLGGDLAAAWSKLEGYAARLALLFQLIRDPTSTAVDEVSMAAGIDLSRWFGEEAARIYSELGSRGDDPEARDRRDQERLVAWIRKQGGAATVRDVTRGPRQFRGEPEAAEAALNQLAAAGFGAWGVGPTSDEGGRPTCIFRLATNGDGDETASSSVNGQVSSPVAGVTLAAEGECEWSA